MTKAALAVLVLLVASGSAAVWYQRDTGAHLPPLRTAEVTRGDLEFTIDATGTVEPEEVVDVGAQVAGRIESLGIDPRDAARTIDYGSPVEVGTVLARINDLLYASEVEQAQAQVESAQALTESTAAQVAEAAANVDRADKDLLQLQAKLFQAERDWKRSEALWTSSRGALSEADYDMARFNYQAAEAALGVGNAAIAQAAAQVIFAKANVAKARADLSQAQATLRRAQTNLGYCTIKSPVQGVIIDRRINVGQTVVSSLNSPSLFLIAKDLKRLEVWASVNEADIGNIRSGQTVRFTVDAYPGHSFHGVVAADQPRLNASMNQNIVTYTVVVDTDNSEGKLLPYLTADVQFQVATHKDVLTVPNTALRWRPSAERLAAEGITDTSADAPANSDDGQSVEGAVWVLDGNRLRPVKVQEILNDGTRTEVVAAELAAGASVAIGESFESTGSATTNPFSPQMFNNKRPTQ
ncbi:MAG: efflux RND transporter periplasmic adaptor subunit [Pirellulales bacterium]